MDMAEKAIRDFRHEYFMENQEEFSLDYLLYPECEEQLKFMTSFISGHGMNIYNAKHDLTPKAFDEFLYDIKLSRRLADEFVKVYLSGSTELPKQIIIDPEFAEWIFNSKLDAIQEKEAAIFH